MGSFWEISIDWYFLSRCDLSPQGHHDCLGLSLFVAAINGMMKPHLLLHVNLFFLIRKNFSYFYRGEKNNYYVFFNSLFSNKYYIKWGYIVEKIGIWNYIFIYWKCFFLFLFCFFCILLDDYILNKLLYMGLFIDFFLFVCLK